MLQIRQILAGIVNFDPAIFKASCFYGNSNLRNSEHGNSATILKLFGQNLSGIKQLLAQMSAEGEGVEYQGANDGNSEKQQTKEDSTQVEIADNPTQPGDQNAGDIGQDSAQVAEKEDVAEKDEEKKEKDEVVDQSIDPNSITAEEISEKPPKELQSPASQKEDPKVDEPAMSVVISEPDKDVVTQEANAQTEGRESPIGNEGDSADSPGKGDDRVIQSQSESDSPLVAPPTSKAEKSIDNEIPAKHATDHPESGGIAKDGFSANGKLNGTLDFLLQYSNNCN